MRKALSLLALLPCLLMAQEKNYDLSKARPFSHLEVGATLGTPGIGLEVATPLNPYLKLRAGVSYLPKMGDVEGYTMKSVGGDITDTDKTSHLAKLLGDMIGNDGVDDCVDMERNIGYCNAKILLDWYPFESKKWHFTAGFYLGTKQIGEVVNRREEAPTMIAIIMYNDMYDQIQGLGPFEYPTIKVGSTSFELDPIAGESVKERFNHYGRVAVQFGEYADGSPFYTEPNRDGVIKAEAQVNAFKPYLGFGYNTPLGKDGRWNLGFDVGALFWGTPHVYSSGYKYNTEATVYKDKIEYVDRICLVHDLHDIGGTVGSSIKFVKSFPVLPVLEVRLSYHIF